MCKVNDDIDGVWNVKLEPGDGCCEYLAHEQNGAFLAVYQVVFEGFLCGRG